jgi:hypothetical protein
MERRHAKVEMLDIMTFDEDELDLWGERKKMNWVS